MQELNSCYDGGQGFIDDVKKALGDIESGDYISAVGDFGTLVTEMPEALENCKNMNADLNKISEWALLFTEPYALAQEVMSNYMAHGADIMAGIAKEKRDWADGNYFKAGLETAQVLNLLVPIHNNEMAAVLADAYGNDYSVDLANIGGETSIWTAAESIASLVGAFGDGSKACWKSAHGRGIGRLRSECPEGKEKGGRLCYPLCEEGYNGVGPVCW